MLPNALVVNRMGDLPFYGTDESIRLMKKITPGEYPEKMKRKTRKNRNVEENEMKPSRKDHYKSSIEPQTWDDSFPGESAKKMRDISMDGVKMSDRHEQSVKAVFDALKFKAKTAELPRPAKGEKNIINPIKMRESNDIRNLLIHEKDLTKEERSELLKNIDMLEEGSTEEVVTIPAHHINDYFGHDVAREVFDHMKGTMSRNRIKYKKIADDTKIALQDVIPKLTMRGHSGQKIRHFYDKVRPHMEVQNRSDD